MIETKTIKEFGKYTLMLHHSEIPEDEAKLAFSLLERWGMVAAAPDGEDSAGRSKLKLSTPDELVERAFAVAKLAFDKARADNLIHNAGPMPKYEADSD